MDYKPESRNETFLEKIKNGDTNDLPEPQSRAEQFLLAMVTGEIDDLPTPQSRVELYLDNIARNGGAGVNVKYPTILLDDEGNVLLVDEDVAMLG